MLKFSAGFTGTQVGMTNRQKAEFVALLRKLYVGEFHHGDCVGADHDAHLLVREAFPDTKIVVHPPTNDSKRAFTIGNEERKPKEYIQRNRYIVMETDLLIATPKQNIEIARSGTWSTVRFAKEVKRPVYIIFPNGEVEHHAGIAQR